MPQFNIYLLRHGELTKSGILCGHTDIALSQKGFEQLETACDKLSNITACISSPLIRCANFAAQYCQKNKLTLETSSAIKEMNFGEWDGKSYESLWQQTALGQFWQNPWEVTPPAGESMQAFITRVDSFWQTQLKQLGNVNTLIISHGGVIRHILAKVLGLPLPGTNHMSNIDVPYAGLIHIQVFVDDDGKPWPKLML